MKMALAKKEYLNQKQTVLSNLSFYKLFFNPVIPLKNFIKKYITLNKQKIDQMVS